MRKIVLVCNAGMSTSIMVEKIKEAAKAVNYEMDIHAYPSAELKEVSKTADAVLLGPQIRFQLNKMKKYVTCPIEVIDINAYGMMDGVKVLDQIKKLVGDE